MGVMRNCLGALLVAELCALAAAHGGENHGGGNLREKSLILTKVYALIIVFLETFVAGISPYFLRWNEAFLALGTQFTAGVFLATAMIHFLGDSHDTFRELKPGSEYGYAEMLAVVGYLLTMLADVAIQGVHRRGSTQTDLDVEGAKHPYSARFENSVDGRILWSSLVMFFSVIDGSLHLVLAMRFMLPDD